MNTWWRTSISPPERGISGGGVGKTAPPPTPQKCITAQGPDLESRKRHTLEAAAILFGRWGEEANQRERIASNQRLSVVEEDDQRAPLQQQQEEQPTDFVIGAEHARLTRGGAPTPLDRD
jgi:hypothetical protein